MGAVSSEVSSIAARVRLSEPNFIRGSGMLRARVPSCSQLGVQAFAACKETLSV